MLQQYELFNVRNMYTQKTVLNILIQKRSYI